MKSHEERSNTIDDSTLDRLVDGDLNDTERRELLLKLEIDPDGWRRCALAFLEDQAWRSALGGMVPAKATEPAPSTPAPPRRDRSWRRRLAVAASMIAATFAAGFGAGGLVKSRERIEVAQASVPEVARPISTTPGDQIREVGWINLVDSSGGESPPQRVPIYSGPGLNERWLRDQPPSVPDHVRAKLERQGYQVEERRKVVSVVLADGRRVSIPVDEVELAYVGQEPL